MTQHYYTIQFCANNYVLSSSISWRATFNIESDIVNSFKSENTNVRGLRKHNFRGYVFIYMMTDIH